MTLRVAITGASGYVGSHLGRFLDARGYAVLPLARRQVAGAVPWELGAQPRLEGVDILVHCAHSFDDPVLNVHGTEQLYAAAERDGVSLIVFISSMAAFAGSRSVYGATKLRIEELTARAGGVSIRPGTVWGGDGRGLMRSLENLVRRLPVVPTIGWGSQRLFLVNIEDLSAVLSRMIEHRGRWPRNVISVANPTALTFRGLLQRIAQRQGVRRLFMPVPSTLIRAPLLVAESLGLRLPVRSDSIVSLTNANPDPDLTLPDFVAVPLRAYE